MSLEEMHLPPPLTFEEIRQATQQAGYFQLLNLHIEDAQDGRGKTRIEVDARLFHPQQFVHGGVLFTLADTAMSLALLSILPAGTRFSTIEAKINYLRIVQTGELIAEAAILHRGNTIAVLESTVYNNQNGAERVAVARVLGTFNIQRPRPS